MIAAVALACGDGLPVKLRICGTGHFADRCHISAAFPDRESCERYNTFASSYCDSVSRPGFIECRVQTPADRPIGVGRCVE